MRRSRRVWLTALGVLLLPAAPAGAATQIGETFDPDSVGCGGTMVLQTGSPGSSYAAPFAGIITSWSFQSNAAPPQLKFKVGRAAGGNNYTIVGDSPLTTPAPNQLNTFPIRIAVQPGDVIGMFATTGGCGRSPAPGYSDHGDVVDHPPGSTMTYGMSTGSQFDISASLESDADGDGFGDETQDLCPTDASLQGPCPDTDPPETTITKGPPDKTKKKQATFEFSSNEPGATFECSLDGGPFAACTSPHSVKVKKGKHSFSVRAEDAAGNVDGSAATDDWKVKKKKRK